MINSLTRFAAITAARLHVEVLSLSHAISVCCQSSASTHSDVNRPGPMRAHSSKSLLRFWLNAQVACGGNHTLAVCAHDTVQQEKEEKKKGYTQRVMSMFTAKPVTVEVPDSRTHSSGPTTAGSGGITPLDRISDGSMSLMHNGSNGMFSVHFRHTVQIDDTCTMSFLYNGCACHNEIAVTAMCCYFKAKPFGPSVSVCTKTAVSQPDNRKMCGACMVPSECVNVVLHFPLASPNYHAI